MNVTQNICLDVTQYNAPQTIQARQGDLGSRLIRVTVTDNGSKFPLQAYSQIAFNCRRVDGMTDIFYGSVNSDGSAAVLIPKWLLEKEGNASCSFSVISPEGEKLTTQSFLLDVDPIEDNGEGLTEEEDYNILTSLLTTVGSLQQSLSTAEASRTEAENARASAEQSRGQAEQSRAAEETKRILAEQERKTNESNRTAAESARVSAESARATAETARTSAETARESTAASATALATQAAQTALAAAAEMTLEDLDAGLSYTYRLTVQNGCPGIILTEIPAQT